MKRYRPMAGPPRVLQVGKFYPPYMGGIETHLYSLCGELRKNIDVSVLVANTSRRQQEDIVDGVPITRAGTLFKLSAAPICPRMPRIIRDTAADLVHIHLPNPVALMSYLASRHPGKLVLTWHSDIVRQRFLGRALAPLLRRALSRSAACIATSPNYVDSSPTLREYRERCRVVPYGIPVERFNRPDPRSVREIRERYGPRLVAAVGRLIYYKGFEYLVRAMARVDARLLIIGDGPLRASLEQDVRAAGLGGRVSFLGEMQNDAVAPYYHAADVFALPSIARSEAFGIVQLEAMACGTPVVNTRLESGVPFVSVDGVTGITVPPREPEPLAAALNLLLDQEHLRRRYGEAARRRVSSEFSLGKMIDGTLAVYREALYGSAPERESWPRQVEA